MICPLCSSDELQEYDQDKFRHYYKCLTCSLVYVPRFNVLSGEEEKHRYDQHQNSSEDPGYISYLEKIASSIKPFLKPGDEGLDFGCGRTTILADLISKDHLTSSYDLYFFPKSEVLQKAYDFIILSEVIEHLRGPRETLLKLKTLLKPHGRFFIKTKCYPADQMEFKNWFYKRDLTHVQFFSPMAFDELVRILKLVSWEKIGEDLYLLR